jgi:hypothetical protein
MPIGDCDRVLTASNKQEKKGTWSEDVPNATSVISAITKQTLTFNVHGSVHRNNIFFFFSCGAATQRGSWPPHS